MKKTPSGQRIVILSALYIKYKIYFEIPPIIFREHSLQATNDKNLINLRFELNLCPNEKNLFVFCLKNIFPDCSRRTVLNKHELKGRKI